MMTRCGIRQQITFVQILFALWWYGELILQSRTLSLCSNIFYEVFRGGTRLAMPKTICTPDSSSLKPGSGATEGVPD